MYRFLTLTIPLIFAAGSLFGQAPAEAEDIRGPKPQVVIPVDDIPSFTLWYAVGGGVIAVALITMLWKKRVRKQFSKTPPEVALAALVKLETNRESLTAEAFANQAAQTVRQYIAARFNMAVPRRTTEEFLTELAQNPPAALHAESDQLQVFLNSCDLAKFAGSELNSTQRADLVKAARIFVNSTSKAIAA